MTIADNVLLISPAAAERLRRLPRFGGQTEAIRIRVEEGGCAGRRYQFTSADTPQPDDTMFVLDGIRFVIDSASVTYLRGALLDYDHGGRGFTVANPNARATCACGASFAYHKTDFEIFQERERDFARRNA